MASVSGVTGMSHGSEPGEMRTADTTDPSAAREAAWADLRAAIRRHPELTDPAGFTLQALVDGLLDGLAIVGRFEDLLGPLQEAMASMEWLDPLSRRNGHLRTPSQRYLPLGREPGQDNGTR